MVRGENEKQSKVKVKKRVRFLLPEEQEQVIRETAELTYFFGTRNILKKTNEKNLAKKTIHELFGKVVVLVILEKGGLLARSTLSGLKTLSQRGDTKVVFLSVEEDKAAFENFLLSIELADFYAIPFESPNTRLSLASQVAGRKGRKTVIAVIKNCELIDRQANLSVKFKPEDSVQLWNQGKANYSVALYGILFQQKIKSFLQLKKIPFLTNLL
eukprot:snap_masked-scaffold_7-processed-gene-10.58-mRNA-1 protein AED:1.00 eAED:1.00 QI:0/-1/0/0/-1/1/1/0/213